jgi:hypothetical protein
MRFTGASRGQASVELLLAVPLAAIVMFAGWQMIVAGHVWWKVNEAARLAARARYVSTQAGDASAGLRRGRRLADALLASSPSRSVSAVPGGGVRVTARVPLVGPFRAALGTSSGPRVGASSRMRP